MRTKNIIKIIFSSAMLQVVLAISGIILPRLIIENYGSEVNGLVSSIKQIIAYFSMVSLGLGAASSVALYTPLDQKDYKQINGILSATRVFFNKTGYIFGILVVLLAVIYSRIVDSSYNSMFISGIILIIGTGGIAEYIIVSKYRVLLIADQKNFVVSRITAQGVILNTIISVILIYQGVSIVVIQMVAVTMYLLRLMITKRYVEKNYPMVNFKAKPDYSLISGRWDAFAFQLPNMIISYSPITIVTFTLGLKAVSVYTVYNMIYSSIAMIVSIFSSGINATFGNIMARSDKSNLEISYNSYSFVYKIVSFAFYSIAFILTYSFIDIYIVTSDGVNYIVPYLAAGFSLAGLFKSIRIPSLTLVEATGKFKENKALNFLEAITVIALSLLLIKVIGLVGVLVAISVSGFIRSVLYIIFSETRILNRKPFNELFKLGINVLIFLVVSYEAQKQLSYFVLENLTNWILIAVAVSIVAFIIFIAVNILIDISSAKDVFKRIKLLIKNESKKMN